MPNRFSDADTIESLIYQVVGAGSVCWENVSGAGEFNSTLAKSVGEDALIRLSQLQNEMVECISCDLEFKKIEACQVVVDGDIKRPVCPDCLHIIRDLSRFNHA
jgi:hypothetical protein